jgi:hypothetical protein
MTTDLTQYKHEYYLAYKQEQLKRQRARQQADPAKYNAYASAYVARLRRETIAYLGGNCGRCGFDDERALQLDHINGGGASESKRLGVAAFYRQILDGRRPDIQLLCANCNWIKRAENHEQPHHGSVANRLVA